MAGRDSEGRAIVADAVDDVRPAQRSTLADARNQRLFVEGHADTIAAAAGRRKQWRWRVMSGFVCNPL